MWIRSQDKEELIKVSHISVYSDTIKGFNSANDVNLGKYSTEEKVLKVMDMIEKFINNEFLISVFQMPQDSEVE